MRIIIFLITSVINCSIASATEFDYQPKKGDKAIELSARYFTDSVTTVAGPKNDLTDTLLKLSFEYGVSDTSSLYANIGYGSATQDPGTSEFEGVDSLNLGYKYSENKIFLAANLGVNLFGDFDCTSNDCNRNIGNFAAVTKLGYYFVKNENMALAAYWDQAVFATQATLEDGSRQSLNYGSSLSVAYEKVKNSLIYGGILSYSYNTQSAGPDASIGNLGFYSFEGTTADSVTLKGYSRYNLNDRQSVFGNIGYTYVLDHEDISIDSESVILASLGFRQLF